MLAERDLTSEQLFDHVLATLNAPVYEARYIDALRVDWPRIPIPASNDTFARSAALGARLAALLDVEVGVDGVSRGALLPGLSSIGLPYGSSYEVTAGWGSVQRKDNGTRLIMPGAGMTTEREWIEPELEALLQVATRHGLSLPDLLDVIGDRAVDVEMNASAGWRAIPSKVWSYTAGGYQALKKWLSYRETAIMGRPLRGEEVLHFAQTARRITEILAMGPALNTTHDEARADAIVWNSGDETGQIVVDDSEVELVDGEEEALVTDDASGAP